MKVYGGLTFNEERKQVRTIVAARSQKEVVEIMGDAARQDTDGFQLLGLQKLLEY